MKEPLHCFRLRTIPLQMIAFALIDRDGECFGHRQERSQCNIQGGGLQNRQRQPPIQRQTQPDLADEQRQQPHGNDGQEMQASFDG